MKNIHKARKEYKCLGCLKKIEKGEIYLRRNHSFGFCVTCFRFLTIIESVDLNIFVIYKAETEGKLKNHLYFIERLHPKLKKALIFKGQL